MIIRKPYAFLIKYFKVIHITIFVIAIYLLIKSRNIYVFYGDYLISGTYNYIENMALSYVHPFMIIVSILLMGIFLLIYLLMKQKEKKVLYYLLGIIFYAISFIVYIVLLSAFNSLEYNSLSNQSIVIYRDIAMVIYYINYFFLTIAFVRGFGFNVKKFNFEKDLKELNITDEDREEIEVGSGIDLENVGNFVRRRKRNLMYYVKENSYVLIVFLIIVTLITGSIIAINKLVVAKVYNEGNIVQIDSINYKVLGSYVTDKDLYGNVIKNNKNYLIVSFELENKSDESLKISMENTRVKVGEDYYYPKATQASKFIDLGNYFKKQVIGKNGKGEYLLIFEIKKKSNDYILQLYRGKKVVNGEAILYYRDVSLKPYTFKNKDLKTYQMGSSIPLKDTLYRNGSFSINSIEFKDIEEYVYSKCITEDNCSDEKVTIVPKGVKKILKVKYGDGTPKSIFNYLNIESDNFASALDINDITPDNYEENTALLEVPSNVNPDNVTLYFNIRGVKVRITK